MHSQLFIVIIYWSAKLFDDFKREASTSNLRLSSLASLRGVVPSGTLFMLLVFACGFVLLSLLLQMEQLIKASGKSCRMAPAQCHQPLGPAESDGSRVLQDTYLHAILLVPNPCPPACGYSLSLLLSNVLYLLTSIVEARRQISRKSSHMLVQTNCKGGHKKARGWELSLGLPWVWQRHHSFSQCHLIPCRKHIAKGAGLGAKPGLKYRHCDVSCGQCTTHPNCCIKCQALPDFLWDSHQLTRCLR